MTDQQICFWLWTRARWLYHLVARFVPLLVRVGLVAEERIDFDYQRIRVSRISAAFYAGAKAFRDWGLSTGQSRTQPPYLIGTPEYRAWVAGWNRQAADPLQLLREYK